MADKKHSERAHALLSASGSPRWLNCTPSARIEEKFPEKEPSIFAEEGTLAHEFGDVELRKKHTGLKTSEYKKRLKELRDHKLYTNDMEDEVEKYTTYVTDQYNASKIITPDATIMIEEVTDLTDYIEEGFGTCDAIIISDGVIEVIDLKYGKGVRVSAEDNDQLKLYGLGALVAFELFYDIQTVKLTIVQPRLDSISSWEIEPLDLLAWGRKEVREKAKIAYKGKGVQKAGSWCKWCKANVRCATLAAVNIKVAQHEFKDPALLTDAQLVEVYNQFDQIAGWISSVSSYMLKEALGGKKWAKLKVVEGRSNRKWKDEKEIQNLLTSEGYQIDQITNTKVKGIGDIEKLVTKKVFPKLLGPYVIKPVGKPALVPVSDSRKEYNTVEQAKQDFK